jgi:hypothetical protein
MTKAEQPAAKRGRPSGLTPEKIKQAEKLAKLGATDLEIADFFGITPVTVWRWKEAHPEFCSALKAGKAEADDRVERSLYARATGYEHDEVDIRVVSGQVVQTPIRKFYPPDTVACIFWLKNRRPEQWRAQPEGGDDEAPMPVKVVIEVKDASVPEDAGT